MFVTPILMLVGALVASEDGRTAMRQSTLTHDAPRFVMGHKSESPSVYRLDTPRPRSTHRHFDLVVGPNAPGSVGVANIRAGTDEAHLEMRSGSGAFIGWYPIFYGRFSRAVAGSVALPASTPPGLDFEAERVPSKHVTTMVVLNRTGTTDEYYVLRVRSGTTCTISWKDASGSMASVELAEAGRRVVVAEGKLVSDDPIRYTWGASDNPRGHDTEVLDRALGQAKTLGAWVPSEIPVSFP